MVAENLAQIPANELPTREYLKEYRQKSNPEPDLAWTDVFPQLCAWLADRESKRKADDIEKARSSSSDPYNYRG